jgi:hypothetical protein
MAIVVGSVQWPPPGESDWHARRRKRRWDRLEARGELRMRGPSALQELMSLFRPAIRHEIQQRNSDRDHSEQQETRDGGLGTDDD